MDYMPGEPLPERALIERFGVSRTPIREAILHLTVDGLVEAVAQSGTFVAKIPTSAIHQIAEIRMALEDMTAHRAAAVATKADVAKLDEILYRQKVHAELDDRGGFYESDASFHEVIAAIAGLPMAWELIRIPKLQIDRVRCLTLPEEGRMFSIIEEHRGIRDAIASKTTTVVRKAMRDHLYSILPDMNRLQIEHSEYFN